MRSLAARSGPKESRASSERVKAHATLATLDCEMRIVLAIAGAVILVTTLLLPWIVILRREMAVIREHHRAIAARRAAAAAAADKVLSLDA